MSKIIDRRILIAEDDLTSRLILSQTLSKANFQIVVANDGDEAWHIIKQADSPRLAILDWMMPGFTGLEIIKKLQYLDSNKHVYTILLTSKTERQDLIRGLKAGADDYLVKPYDADELLARIEVGRRIIQLEEDQVSFQNELKKYATDMEELATDRAKQLVHADRMATLGLLSAGMAHEINNPLTFISGNRQVLSDCWPTIKNSLEQDLKMAPANSAQIGFCLEEIPKIINGVGTGVSRVKKIVDGLKSFARQNETIRKPSSIHDCINQALILCKNRLKYNVEVITDIPEDMPDINVDKQQIEQVLVNLLYNAADAIEEQQKQGSIEISTRLKSGKIEIIVEDNGGGLPEKILAGLFNPFFTTKAMDKGTGLGLSICQGIIEEHDGTIRAENRSSGGARFIVELPLFTTTEGATK